MSSLSHYNSTDALRLSGKESSSSENLSNVHGYGVTPKQELYSSPKRLDYSSKLDYSEKSFGSSLVKDQYSSRLTGNLTPLGSNSSIMTTPSPPITPQSLNGPGNVYHPDNYNSFHWPGSSDYIRSYSTGHHHQGYGQSAYNSPYYPSQVSRIKIFTCSNYCLNSLKHFNTNVIVFTFFINKSSNSVPWF